MRTLIGFLVIFIIALVLYFNRAESAELLYPYRITLEPPTERTDGTPLTNLAAYRVEWRLCVGCEPEGMQLFLATEPQPYVVTLPRNQYYWNVLALDSDDLISEPSNTVIFHVAGDTDGDGVDDYADNCTLVQNPNQVDSDADGYGNACDGDLNGNGYTNAWDTIEFRNHIGQPSVPPIYDPADFNTNGYVNAQDSILFRQMLGNPPGPSGLKP